MTDPAIGQILDDQHPDPEAHDVTPGWIGRNRTMLENGRKVSQTLMIVAPPPARIALGVVCVATDALLLADEMGRRLEDENAGAVRAGAIILEGAALLAISRFAPARLAANLAGIQAARTALDRLAARARA